MLAPCLGIEARSQLQRIRPKKQVRAMRNPADSMFHQPSHPPYLPYRIRCLQSVPIFAFYCHHRTTMVKVLFHTKPNVGKQKYSKPLLRVLRLRQEVLRSSNVTGGESSSLSKFRSPPYGRPCTASPMVDWLTKLFCAHRGSF